MKFKRSQLQPLSVLSPDGEIVNPDMMPNLDG